uniref:ARAD1C36806p n=1 Tax=Blastobotrys adeninivorans TaxID=409370 RepID=A0A060T8G4_BLAAD
MADLQRGQLEKDVERTAGNTTPEDGDLEDEVVQLSNTINEKHLEEQRLIELTPEYLVEFAPDDPNKPINWSFKKKAMHTAFYGITTFGAQFNSATMSSSVDHVANYFGTSRTVATLCTSLYILGVAFGPMIFAPFSEVFGRKPGVLIPFFISIAFTLGTAASESMSAVLCTRFFAGLFAAAPVVSSGGVLADIWAPAQRGTSLVFYAYFVVAGPAFAPIIGSLLTKDSETSWRWALWFASALNGLILVIDVLTLSETYPPVLQTRMAKKLRISTGNWLYHAKHEEWRLTAKEFLTIHLARPFAMLATPIVFFIALFASYVFGILYLVVTSIPDAFVKTRNFGYVECTLPMISMFIGAYCGGLANIHGGKRYARLVKENGGKSLPEERMVVMMRFGWLMPAGIFIFSWTSRDDIHWIVPCIGIAIMGCGFFTIFQGCLNYLVDAFSRYSASAIAANTFTRSVFGAVFPLFGTIMFRNLGVNWGGSLLGFIALGMIPIPFVFYFFGKNIRARNPYIQLVT